MKRKQARRFVPIWTAVLLIAALWFFGNGRGAERWANIQESWMGIEGVLERADGDYGIMTSGPGMVLRAGRYRLDYDIQTDAPNKILLSSGGSAAIEPAAVTISPDAPLGFVEFTVYNETENFEILVDYEAGSYLRLNRLDLTGNACTDRVMSLTLLLLGFIALYLMYLSGYLNRERAVLFLVMGLAVLIASTPSLKKNLTIGDDMDFHLSRLGNLTSGLMAGQFPVRLGGYANRGYGVATPIYYMDLFLHIPAAMVILGTSVQYAMNVFLILINLMTAAAMFVCARRIFRNETVGALASVLYTLAAYRLTDMYTRSALGEGLAMAFMPLLALGLWEVFFGDETKWPLLALSAAAIFESHMISTLLCAGVSALVFLLFFRRALREKRLKAVLKAVVCCTLLCAFSLAPLLTYSGSGIGTDGLLMWNADNDLAPAQLLFGTVGDLKGDVQDASLSSRALEIGAPLLLAALAALMQMCKAWGEDEKKSAFLLALGAGFALMATELFPWAHLDGMFGGLSRYIQFPWRMLMMTDFFFALAGGYGLYKVLGEKREAALAGVLALCMVTAMPLLTAQTKNNRVMPYGGLSNPGFVNWDYVLEGTQPETIQDGSIHLFGDVDVQEVQKTGTTLYAEVSAAEDAEITLPLFGFEGYQAEVDGQKMEVGLGEQNRLSVKLPEGTAGSLHVYFAGRAWWRIAEVISLVTLLALMARPFVRKCGFKKQLNAGRKF